MKSFHIAAYTFNADIVCCDCIAEWAAKELKDEGYFDDEIEDSVRDNAPAYETGVFGFRSTALLQELAHIWKINIEDEYSYDSDDFPKVVFVDQIENDEHCGKCGELIP